MLSTLRPSDDDHRLFPRGSRLLSSSTTSILGSRSRPPPPHAVVPVQPPPADACAGTGTGTGPAKGVERVEDSAEDCHSDSNSDLPSDLPPSSSCAIIASPSGPAEAGADADAGHDSPTTTTAPPTATATASEDAAADNQTDTDADPEVGDPSPSPVPPLEEEGEVEKASVTCGTGSAAVVVGPPNNRVEEEDPPTTVTTAPSAPAAARHHHYNLNLGMRNLGNTCYLNSAVQMLVSMGGFVRDLEAYDDAAAAAEAEAEERMAMMRRKAKSGSDDDEGEGEGETVDVAAATAGEDGGATAMADGEKGRPSLRREVLRLARSLRLAQTGTDANAAEEGGSHDHAASASALAVDPSHFKGAVDRLSCLFEGYRQQDSHEFLSTVLDLLQDEILEEEKARKKFLSVAAAEEGDGSTDVEAVDTGTSQNSSTGGEIGEGGTAPVGDAVLPKEDGPQEDSGAGDGVSMSKPEQMSTSFSELGTEDISFLLGNDDSVGPTSSADIPQDVTVCTRRQEEKLKIPRRGERCQSSSSSSSSYATPTGLPLLLGGRMTALATPGLFSSAWIAAPGKLRPVEAETETETETETATETAMDPEVPAEGGGPDEGPAAAAASAPMGDDAGAPDREVGAAADGSPRPLRAEQEPAEVAEDAPSTSAPRAEGRGPPPDCEASTEDAASSPPVVSMSMSMSMAEEPGVASVAVASDGALRSPVEKHFGALVEVRLVCDSCSYTRTKTELYRYFSVDILPPATPDLHVAGDDNGGDDSRVATVEEGLRSFFAPDNRELKCEKCFCENATEYKEIVRLPSALLLHVKRFIVDYSPIRGVSFRKDKSRVEFGNDVDLSPYCNSTVPPAPGIVECGAADAASSTEGSSWCTDCEEGDDDVPSSPGGVSASRYSLKSVVHHIGSSASCGHYTAHGSRLVATATAAVEDDADEGSPKDQATPTPLIHERTRQDEVTGYEKRWLHFDDGYVTEVSPHDEGTLLGPTAQGTAYMVMYQLAEGTE